MRTLKAGLPVLQPCFGAPQRTSKVLRIGKQDESGPNQNFGSALPAANQKRPPNDFATLNLSAFALCQMRRAVVKADSVDKDGVDFTAQLRTRFSREEQFHDVIAFFERSLEKKDHIADEIADTWDYFTTNNLWDVGFPDLASFERCFIYIQQIKEIHKDISRTRARTIILTREVEALWGNLGQAFPKIKPPKISWHAIQQLHKLSRLTSRENAIDLVEREVDRRRARLLGRRGPNPIHLQVSDVHAVVSEIKAKGMPSALTVNQDLAADLGTQPQELARKRLAESPPQTLHIHTVKSAKRECKCPEKVLVELGELEKGGKNFAERLEAFNCGVDVGLHQFCYDHLRRYFNLSMNFLSNTAGGQEGLNRRITALYNHLKGHLSYQEFLEAHLDWFNATARPHKPSDDRIPFRYPHLDHRAEPRIRPREIFALFTDDKAYDRFLREGSVVVPNVFGYLNTPEVQAKIEEEFALYRYHLRLAPGSGSIGFLRNCFYSIIQQAIRMDPGYYMLNVAARPHHQTRLISYPYVAKHVMPSHRTGFLHLDINIDKYFSPQKTGLDQLTSSVSLDEEDDDNCTVVVPGFHNHVRKWHKRVKHRLGQTLGGSTTEGTHNYRAEYAKLYGYPKPIPCSPFGVRLSLPTILHGSSERATKTRRVIYPWFTAIGDDHEQLEMPGQHSWSDVARLHRDREAPERGVSGKVAAGRPPYPFPAAVKLGSVSPLSDALVGRRRWDDDEVLLERDVLFGEDNDQALALLETVRKKLYAEVVDGYAKLRGLEEWAFGDLSFYRNHGVQRDGNSEDEDGAKIETD